MNPLVGIEDGRRFGHILEIRYRIPQRFLLIVGGPYHEGHRRNRYGPEGCGQPEHLHVQEIPLTVPVNQVPLDVESQGEVEKQGAEGVGAVVLGAQRREGVPAVGRPHIGPGPASPGPLPYVTAPEVRYHRPLPRRVPHHGEKLASLHPVFLAPESRVHSHFLGTVHPDLARKVDLADGLVELRDVEGV